jgi:hypothetical protein
MKTFLVFLLLSCIGNTTKADVYAGGFLILSTGDTVFCQIKIAGKKKVTGYSTLVVQSFSGEEKIYNAKDKEVLEYGYQYMGKNFVYRFVEVSKNYQDGFFRLIDNGKNYKLYVTYLTDINNGVTTTLPHYAIFKPNGEYKDLTTHVLGNWKKNLRIILSDNPEALQELETISRKEIEAFVKRLNLQE